MKKFLYKPFLLVAFLMMTLAATAGAQTPAVQTSDTSEFSVVWSGPDKLTPTSDRYIVRLDGPALASYNGGVRGLAATSNEATGATKLNASSATSVAYLDYLKGQQDVFVETVKSEIGRNIKAIYNYTAVLNGVVLELNSAEAKIVAGLPNVVSMERDYAANIQTDNGPEWMGADAIWNAVGGGTKGEGIIVGILDTGINMDHPSFADVGADGYDHTNPFGAGVYVGACASNPAQFQCNDKLIGGWDFADPDWPENDGPEDSDGHGSHVASTTAGNVVNSTLHAPTTQISGQISGVAPHANIIAYDVCGSPSCFTTAVVAALNQSILDGVDVLNESIGIGEDTFSGSKQQAYLDVYAAGIFAVRAAGNDGPAPETVGPEPVWTISTAASTHNRKLVNGLVGMSGGGSAPADIDGLGFTSSYGPATLVYAGDVPSGETPTPELCAAGAAGDNNSPWPPGTFNGEIVVCMRGEFGRVEKGTNVLAAGAGGMVLIDDGNGLVGDGHDLPAVHISVDDGATLLTWMMSGSGHMAEIAGFTSDDDIANGDQMAGFSSRGPSPVDSIKPDIAAPGVSIWAAAPTNGTYPVPNVPEFMFLSGTSMASPHIAGAGALLAAANPTWTPDDIRSALMTTATNTNTFKEDGTTPTDAFDVGGGRAELANAVNAGLTLRETVANYQAADFSNVAELNIPSMQSSDCSFICSWTRTFTSLETTRQAVTWDISVAMDDSAIMASADTAQETVASGGTFDVTVTVDASTSILDQWNFGALVLSDSSGTFPDVRLPIAIFTPSATDATTFSKTGTANVDVSDTINYGIAVNNTTDGTSMFSITDDMPAGVSYDIGSFSASAGSVTEGANSITWDVNLNGGTITNSPINAPGAGYISLADIGIEPAPCPADCDEGGFPIFALDIQFLGKTYTEAFWSINGTVELGGSTPISGANVELPNPAGPNNILAPLWADLDLTNAGEWYLGGLINNTTGQTFTVFEWEDAPRADGTGAFTFQLWFADGTDQIWFTYGGFNPGSSTNATIGAEGPLGVGGYSLFHNGTGALPAPGANARQAVTTTAGQSASLSFTATADSPGTRINEANLTYGGGISEKALASTVIAGTPSAVELAEMTPDSSATTMLLVIAAFTLLGASAVVIRRR